MKTILPEHINSKQEGKAFLAALSKNGEAYHPDDDPADIIDRFGDRLFTDDEAERINRLFDEIYLLDLDCCGYLLHIGGHEGYEEDLY